MSDSLNCPFCGHSYPVIKSDPEAKFRCGSCGRKFLGDGTPISTFRAVLPAASMVAQAQPIPAQVASRTPVAAAVPAQRAPAPYVPPAATPGRTTGYLAAGNYATAGGYTYLQANTPSAFATAFSPHGRINRTTWWIVSLACTLLVIVYLIIQGLGTIDPMASWSILALSPLVLWARITSHIKRFHDRGKSGWWALLEVVPVVGTLWCLIELGFLPGTQGANRYGWDPEAQG